jgi:excisionase family DNA binding protein
MFDERNTFITLDRLATRLNLPKTYLVELAEHRTIPALNVNGRLRFNVESVRQALNELATKGAGQ